MAGRIRRAGVLLAASIWLAGATNVEFSGMWSSDRAVLVLGSDGGRLQIGCLVARFPAVALDSNRHFIIRAEIETLSTMPPGEVADVPGKGATITGRSTGGEVELALEVEGEAPQRFTVQLGHQFKAPRCL